MDATDSSGPIKALTYLTVEKAPLYRAIMRAFTDAKERFALHLRTAEVLAAVRVASGADPSRLEQPEIDIALSTLREWGNLEAHPDMAAVSTVEEFYRPRFLYQMSVEGEAAERAVRQYLDALVEPGELQTAALTDIHMLLEELSQLASEEEPDAGKVHRVLLALRDRFEELTTRAQAFMGSLQRTIDLHAYGEAKFFAYKRTLVEYLERFVGDLVIAAAAIAESIQSLERPEGAVDALLVLAARREVGQTVEVTDEDELDALDRWRGRWAGLRGWFVGSRSRPSQSEVLRARARSAIPALLAAIAGLHDRRATRTDRVADLKTLARWFAEAGTDDDAHRLWRAAFALAPARHLSIDDVTLAQREAYPVAPSKSWLGAPPIRITPRLRATGRYTRRGRANNVIDRSEQRALLVRLAELEAEQIERARRKLATGTPMRLSDIGELDAVEFQLLLDLLGEALGARTSDTESVEAMSSDGTLRIVLTPIPEAPEVVLRTSAGDLRGPDFVVTISDPFEQPQSIEGRRGHGSGGGAPERAET